MEWSGEGPDLDSVSQFRRDTRTKIRKSETCEHELVEVEVS